MQTFTSQYTGFWSLSKHLVVAVAVFLCIGCGQLSAFRDVSSRSLATFGFGGYNSPSSLGYTTMDVQLQRKRQCTQQILEIKKSKNLTWEGMAKAVGRSPVWVTACCLGEASMDEASAQKLVDHLGERGNTEMKQILTEPPIKGQVSADVLIQDPCIYRLHEITLVYGNTIKELIQEKFGDGIMSAIDFKMEVEKEEDPAGDRVRLIMSGKYLPYKRW